MTHQHQFIKLEELTRLPQKRASNSVVQGQVWLDEYGARVGCPLCGEIRIIWANGEVITETPGHDPNTRNS